MLYFVIHCIYGNHSVTAQHQIFYLTRQMDRGTCATRNRRGRGIPPVPTPAHPKRVERFLRIKEGMMVKRVFTIVLSLMMLSFTCLALAGGPPAAPYAAPCATPYPAKPCAVGGNPCAYWGDAPLPGLCGGVIALPFLVVGSLLGGNTMGPGGCPPPAYQCGPRPYPTKVCAPPPCGPGYGYGPGAYDGLLTGLPCFDLCAGLLGGITGGPSLLW